LTTQIAIVIIDKISCVIYDMATITDRIGKVAESKYGKYVITSTPQNMAHPHLINSLWINNELNGTVKGAFYIETCLVTRADDGPKDKPHNHDFDEYLIFLGTNPADPSDLCGEIEIWLGDEEKFNITKTCAIFLPKGLYHTPLLFKRVDRPIMMIHAGNTLKYRHLSYSQNPKWAHLNEPLLNKS
jgi:hypothetical protein